jgi:hypothetical protein
MSEFLSLNMKQTCIWTKVYKDFRKLTTRLSKMVAEMVDSCKLMFDILIARESDGMLSSGEMLFSVYQNFAKSLFYFSDFCGVVRHLVQCILPN